MPTDSSSLLVSQGQVSADGRRRRGDRQRAVVLQVAMQEASMVGLEGLTFGRLATLVDLPKSNLSVLFGSKQGLQLATIDAAREIFVGRVIAPTIQIPSALQRLQALGDSWMDYLEADRFVGGCFFCAASAELDDRPGPLRDAVVATMGEWLDHLRGAAEAAIESSELRSSDPEDVAFLLNAIGMAANFTNRLFEQPEAITLARRLWATQLLPT